MNNERIKRIKYLCILFVLFERDSIVIRLSHSLVVRYSFYSCYLSYSFIWAIGIFDCPTGQAGSSINSDAYEGSEPGRKMGESPPATRVRNGVSMCIDQLSAISPMSWTIDRSPMATPFRNLTTAKDSANSGEYLRRGGGAEMARKAGNR